MSGIKMVEAALQQNFTLQAIENLISDYFVFLICVISVIVRLSAHDEVCGFKCLFIG